METENKIKEAVQNGNFVFTYHSNDPFPLTADILKETNKALNIKIESTNKTIWIPKSALVFENYSFTVKQWFKKALIKENNNYKFKALGVMI